MSGGGGAVPTPRARPFPLVLAGPSGAGKTTIGRALVERRPDVRFSVSATTRPPRPDEVDGRDYRFLSRDRFEGMVAREEFLEHAEVHGHLYGTPRANLEEARAAGAHLLLDIDVQGARSVRRIEPGAVTVFLLPPDGTRIVERLRRRGSEAEDAVRARLGAARAELSAIEEFDYVIVNDRLAAAIGTLECIVTAEARRLARLEGEARERVRALADEIRRALV